MPKLRPILHTRCICRRTSLCAWGCGRSRSIPILQQLSPRRKPPSTRWAKLIISSTPWIFWTTPICKLAKKAKHARFFPTWVKFPAPTPRRGNNVGAHLTTRNALELHRWKDALALVPEGDAFDQQLVYMTRAIAAARTGDIKLAEENLKSLKKAFSAEKRKDKRWQGFRRDVAESWLEFAKGNHEKALKKMRAAAEMQDRDDPGPFSVTAREMLADMLQIGRAHVRT